MKNARFLILAVTIATVGQSIAQVDVKNEIQRNYDKVSKLSMTREKKKLESLARRNASTNFVYIDSMKNSLDLAATIRQNNDQLSRVYKFNANSNKIIGLKRVGPDFLCTVKTNYDVFLDPAGKNRVVGTTISQDTWMKSLKGWKIRESRIVKETSFQNGKPVN